MRTTSVRHVPWFRKKHVAVGIDESCEILRWGSSATIHSGLIPYLMISCYFHIFDWLFLLSNKLLWIKLELIHTLPLFITNIEGHSRILVNFHLPKVQEALVSKFSGRK